jgi:hypothetical protein
MTRLASPLVAVVAGAIALIAAWLMPVAETAPAAAVTRPDANPLALPAVPPIAELAETTARPLFSPTRRPLPGTAATEAAPGTAAALFNRYRLQGVVIDGSRRRVLLAPTPAGKMLSIAEGESVDGWTIERIAPERLTLRSGNRVETVELGKAR